MGTIYEFWFDPEDIDLFYQGYGFLVGALSFFIIPFIFASIYYLVLGRNTDAYSSITSWLLFGLASSLIVFLITLTIIGFKLKENIALEDFHIEIWIFSIVNGIAYGGLWYFISSLLFNNLSVHSKFIPFNLFK
jgi:hypothetical protein